MPAYARIPVLAGIAVVLIIALTGAQPRAAERPAALRVPAACAASSSTGTPSASISATGARLPNRCTATTALVAGVSAAATVSAVTQYVSGSTSQKTGRAPVGGTASAVA